MKAQGKVWILYDTVKAKKTKPLNLVQAQATVLSLQSETLSKILIWTPGWEKWVPLDKYLSSNQEYFVMTPEFSKVTSMTRDKTVNVDTVTAEKNFMSSPSEETEIENTHFTKIINDEKTSSAPPSGDYGYYHPDFRADQINIHIKPKLKFAPPSENSQSSHSAPPAAKSPSPTPSTKTPASGTDERRTDERHNHKIEVTLVSKKGKTFKTYSNNISMGGIFLQDPIPNDFANSSFNLILTNRFEKDVKKSKLYIDGRIIGDFSDPRHLSFINLDDVTRKALENLLISYQNQSAKIPNKKIG